MPASKGVVHSDIRSLRLAKRLRQLKLAELAGVSVTLLSRWERGLAEPSKKDYSKMAAVLNRTASALETAQKAYNSTVIPGEGIVRGKSLELEESVP